MRTFKRAVSVACILVITSLAGAAPVAGPPTSSSSSKEPSMDWTTVDDLISEQKLQAALELVEKILDKAENEKDADNWTRALVETVQLRIALHGYETAIRFLKQQPWPDDATARTVLDLYYAHSLITYTRSYSWEIRKRERIVSSEEVDLKNWTLEEILTEAFSAIENAWQQRESWGAEPIGAIARYIDQNNYPPRIRGTLRDLVSYLWVDLLSDTSLWTPRHSNEIFRLDEATLISGQCEQLCDVDLGDPTVHPLVKIAAILADLEAWHTEKDRLEAGLEATLERLRRLHSALAQEEDKQAIQTELEHRLETFDRAYPWWSMGMAALAEFTRDLDRPDSLIRARAIAQDGAERHPKSPGGQRCQVIVAGIESASYALSGMAADGADKPSIRINHKNLPIIYLRAYRYDLVSQLVGGQDANMLPTHRDVEALLEGGTPDAEWNVDLPQTRDFRQHATFTSPPIENPGAYVVIASARRDFGERGNLRVAINFIQSDLVLVRRQLADAEEFTARSGASGAPIENAEISLYRFDYRGGHQLIGKRLTAEDGRAVFGHDELSRRRSFAIAVHRRDIALDQSVYPYTPRRSQESRSTLIYTDRSIYRPGQTMSFKIVAYEGNREVARYRTAADQQITVSLLDANGQDVERINLTTNTFGSAAGEFTIPEGRTLGAWRIRSSFGGTTGIRVEEYKRPTFEVEISDPASPMRLNQSAQLAGEARYYFGLPVTSGEVRWSVSRQPVFPPWWFWWKSRPSTSPQIIASGTTEVDSGGTFRIEFSPEADERQAADSGVTYRFRLSAEVTDEGGETRSAERSFRLGFVSIQASISSETDFATTADGLHLDVRRADLNGIPKAGSGRWRLHPIVQPETTPLPADVAVAIPEDEAEYATIGDRQRARWAFDYSAQKTLAAWDTADAVLEGVAEHGADGSAVIDIASLEPGPYRFIYETEDDFGATCSAKKDVIVVGATETSIALPMIVLAERHGLRVGDTLNLFVRSGLEDQTLVVELFSDQQRHARRVLHSGDDDEIQSFPIDEDLRGGFSIRVTGVRDHQVMEKHIAFQVPWDDRRLELELESFRDRIRPGNREVFRVHVKDPEGNPAGPGMVELLAYMYDISLDTFAPHNPPNPGNLLPSRSGIRALQASIGSAPRIWQSSSDWNRLPQAPYFHGDSIKQIDSYGIGGPGGRGRYFMQGVRSQTGAVPPPEASRGEYGAVTKSAMEDSAGAPAETEESIVLGVPESEPPPDEASGADELRSDFSETAFFEPHLLSNEDGTVTVEFEVPDSVTEWNLWIHALTRNLHWATLNEQTRSVKDLMVRPYLPRFLREGDRATIKVVVNNAGEEAISGDLELEIFDPATDESLLGAFGITESATRSFEVDSGGGASLSFDITTPSRVGPVGFRVLAHAGALRDGEQRDLPVLPSRLHLAQSRFVSLTDDERRIMTFEDMAADDDPTLLHDQLVVTIDAQLFFGVLKALPYLVDYPYECVEQSLNRFVSTGILSSLYAQYPAVAEMAEKLSERDSRFEQWNEDDANRRMLLEETPWLVQARGGDESPDDLIKVLDPAIAQATREEALAKIRKSQTSIGAFPWWPGGPPSPYMTLYVVYGFSKGLEFGVDAPRDVIVRAWSYLHQHYIDDIVNRAMVRDCCWEMVTFLNYVLSNYPDDSWTGGVFTIDERRRMLDFSFSHWKQHSPQLKAYLAMTLKRMGRGDDATLVFDSVMDSSRTERDLGTFWAPEDRAWLWYNDTIETHALALRALTELDPDDRRRQGLVHWLFLNKKLNHWKSTRATSEVIYSLAHYLRSEEILAIREEIDVKVGDITRSFIFEPDQYSGDATQLVVDEIDPQSMSTIVVDKHTRGLAFASATWHFSTEQLPSEARGDLFAVEKHFFRRFNRDQEWVLEALEDGDQLSIGDQIEVQLSLRAAHAAEYVHVRDPRAAGFEPESLRSGYRWDLGIACYEEIRDSGANFFFENLPAGQYTFSYRLRANMNGIFRVGPAVLQSMYAPEFTAYSSGRTISVR